MSATMNECQVGIHDLWQVGMHDLWQVYVHKTVRNWNVLYMTCSRYGWINTGSLVAFWPIACSKHNIPCSKSVWLWSINYPAPDWGTCWSWCWKRLPGNDYLPTTISAVSFSCSNSPQITTVCVATIPQQHLLLMHHKQCSASSHVF